MIFLDVNRISSRFKKLAQWIIYENKYLSFNWHLSEPNYFNFYSGVEVFVQLAKLRLASQ